ncbi:MAG: lipoate--protein ligase family protein, partial [Limisphaerales bacterium]
EQNSEEILRFWEPKEYFVVAGYGNKIELEIKTETCRAKKIPILRRCSGGGTVLQGLGCLNYSLILKLDETGPTRSIPQTNYFVMNRHREALQTLWPEKIEIKGHTDLAINDLKFSGNAQRRKKNYLIFHGTFLLDFNLGLVEIFLPKPSKQPEYRANRSHESFLRNLKISPAKVKAALKKSWNANTLLKEIPDFESLKEKYESAEWNFKF